MLAVRALFTCTVRYELGSPCGSIEAGTIAEVNELSQWDLGQ